MFQLELGASSHYTALGVSPTASAAELLEVRSRLQTSIKQKMRTADEKEKAELEEQLKVINAAGEALCRPEKRKEYDSTNAHVRFFMARPAAAPVFNDRLERFFVLHGVLRFHLSQKGVTILHLCDLDREDFSGDETPNGLLDELMGR
jgi:curved DNA-binding protein CbpA